MIWLTWRQARLQVLTAAAALAAFAILLAATGPHLASLYATSGVSGCRSGCANLASNFLRQLTGAYGVLYALGVVLILLVPAVIGIFWGAPLIAGELENGTSALAWGQSVTRARWVVVKLTAGALAAMAVTEALSLMQAWWAAPIGRAVGDGGSAGSVAGTRFDSLIFASHGITPLGYAAFAFTLGATVGALLRRTIPAMAVTLAVFAAVQIVTPLWIRPHLFPAQHVTVSVATLRNISLTQSAAPGNASAFKLTTQSLPGQTNAWVLSSEAVHTTGQLAATIPAACTAPAIENGPALFPCLARHGIREAVSYQPGHRYWAFQWAETGIYLAAALALAACGFRLVSRRRS